ncbi:LPXTG cell wall anchor domain-containing protein [Mesobacillus subterraneus]|uniref:LPXTG cell wall anchor domain-containing protein n=1 Tax=Mesobacillus subterraneus TaxID=285983 RepID=A0A3R9F131_9BACI|nr:LPXTG cell wall anchor domain-containing protein [Mesobacillus subterraneus]RSD27564.1 LPXTG cell wall anchor domain-containing protein [Mesobacillus subterraneus]
MKLSKRFFIITAFMLMFMITLPVSGTFAEGNKTQNLKEEKQQNDKPAQNGIDQAQPSAKADDSENKADKTEESNTSNNEDADLGQAGEEENKESDRNKEDPPVEEAVNDEETEGDSETPLDEEGENEPAENDSPPAENGNKSTQVHLHINKCMAPVESGFVLVNGEWQEMTNPGSSPLFKLFDDGEFIKDDITAFKLIFTTGQELVVQVSEIRVGVEAEGSINYWLDDCELPVEDQEPVEEPAEPEEKVNLLSFINIMFFEYHEKIEKVTLLMMNGQRFEFERNKQLFTLSLTEKVELEMIRGIEITRNGETKLILLSQLSEESIEISEGELTLQLNGNVLGGNVEEVIEEDESSEVPADGSGNDTGGTTTQEVWNGKVLPQTGEGSRMMFYVLGFMIAAAGVLVRFRNPIKN